MTDGLSSGSGVGVGLAFFRFDLLIGVGVSVALFRRGEAVGDGVAVGSFAEAFRCLRAGLGVGVGARIFLIFLPNDSSAAGPASTAPNKITSIRTHFITRCSSVRCPQRRFERVISICAEDSARYRTEINRQAGCPPAPQTRCPCYDCASSCRIALFKRMPPSKFSSGKFSLGE